MMMMVDLVGMMSYLLSSLVMGQGCWLLVLFGLMVPEGVVLYW
jgi:hypothetical protein